MNEELVGNNVGARETEFGSTEKKNLAGKKDPTRNFLAKWSDSKGGRTRAASFFFLKSAKKQSIRREKKKSSFLRQLFGERLFFFC